MPSGIHESHGLSVLEPMVVVDYGVHDCRAAIKSISSVDGNSGVFSGDPPNKSGFLDARALHEVQPSVYR